jgi:hypothetical protein
MSRFVLHHDGVEVVRGTEDECVRYIHRNHSYSFDHAIKYEGFTLLPVASRDPASQLRLARGALRAIERELKGPLRLNVLETLVKMGLEEP